MEPTHVHQSSRRATVPESPTSGAGCASYGAAGGGFSARRCPPEARSRSLESVREVSFGIAQLSQHQPDWRKLDEFESVTVEILEVFGQPSAAVQPGKRPSTTQRRGRTLNPMAQSEHGHVGVAPLGSGLIQADGSEIAEVEALDRAADIVLDVAPQPLVGDLDDTGGGHQRHLANQHQGRLLEQQSEATALPSPRGSHPQHAVLVAVCAWDLGGDVAMVLEKVQMAPGEFGEVVGFTGLAADRAGKQAAAVGGNLQVYSCNCLPVSKR
jgi:hypothetical protein